MLFSKNINGYHFILLNPSINKNASLENGGIYKTQNISAQELEWLERDLDKNELPCIVFTHFGIAEDDMKGNWWFEKEPDLALLNNRNKIKNIFRKHTNEKAVFSGHQHWTKSIIEDNINYYLIGSLTENINNDGIPDGVFYEVDLDQDKIHVKEHHNRTA